MAERPDIVDIDICELVGELKLDINSRIIPDNHFNNNPPVICSTYFMNADLILQIILKHNATTDMIEARLEVLTGPRDSLKFKIKYGLQPFHPLQGNPQIFIYTTTNRRSKTTPICKFAELLDFLVDNEIQMRFEYAEFVSCIIVSPRELKTVLAKYRIPTVNDCDCDHKLICEGREIRVHKRLLMGASRFFYRLFMAYPERDTTNIDELDESKQLEKETLTALLRFMYGLSISHHNLQTSSLLGAAREYEVVTLFNVCESTMIKQMSNRMAPELFYIGKTEKASKLTFEAAKFILANYKEIKESFEWKACLQAFPKFFEPIIPNPLKYFRGIIFPEIRSRSTGDIWSGASFLLTSPKIVLTRPVQDETSSIAGSRCSENTSMLSVDSLDNDFEPIPRKRSSPVVSRRRPESMGLFRMRSLDDALPNPTDSKFSRVLLKNKLLSSESKFEETFGPVSDSSPSLSRSMSLPDNSDNVSGPDHYQFDFYEPDLVPMDCREDSNFTSTLSESGPADSMDPGILSRERSDLPSPSLPSMRSLEFGFTYSYSSDSVFERRETPKSMSKVLTPAVDMSVSEYPSSHQDRSGVSPKAMKRIDFGMFTHPEARTLSDISSIPVDSSLSIEPESSTGKTRKRREKRMKKMADKTRKFLPSNSSTNSPYDFSSSEGSSGIIPRPTFIKEFPTEPQQQLSKKFQQRIKGQNLTGSAKPDSSSSWLPSSENKPPTKKVTFGKTDYIPHPPEEEIDQALYEQLLSVEDYECEEQKYYESWLEAASYYSIQDVFEEATNSASVDKSSDQPPTEEKSWDEKDEEELTAPLFQRIHSSSSSVGYKKFNKGSPPSTRDLGGGVIRKTPSRFHMASIDDPVPLSSSESAGTTSSSLSSTQEHKKVKRTLSDRFSTDAQYNLKEQPTIERGQSFVDLRTVRRSSSGSQQHRNTPALAGVFSIGLQESINVPQQTEEPSIQIFEEIDGTDDENQTGGK